MQLATTELGGVLVVTVREPRLDRTNRERFKNALAAHIRPGVKIALGLDGVRYVDGPGCGAVLSLHKETTELGGELKIFSLHAPVRSLFQKLHLHRRVHTFNRREEVMRAFSNGD
jgi:anti-anti-sigma factor